MNSERRSGRVRTAHGWLWGVVVACLTSLVCAQDERVVVRFEVNQATTPGQSVFVLGSLPELGNNDVRLAVKLEPSSYPLWGLTVSLPAGKEYTYRYYLRNDGPGQTSLASNGTPVGALLAGSTAAQPVAITSKTLVADLDFVAPVLRYGVSGQPVQEVPMVRCGPVVVAGSPQGLTRWYATGFGQAGKDVQVVIREADGTRQVPASVTHTMQTDAAFMHNGEFFDYIPQSFTLSEPRRDYSPASPPTITSTLLGETRRYRVYLPRGYDEQTERRYPVIYFHDGQNIFESGAFGSWNADDDLGRLTSNGAMQEVIVVAVDHTDRFRDFIPARQASAYVRFLRDELKPVIDAQYRTLPDAHNTGAFGSSLGGLVSLYMGWDFPETFAKVGAFSGAWQVDNAFYNRVRTQPARDVHVYLDSGDSGTSNDNYWGTFNLRDALLSGQSPRYIAEGTLRHVVGYGQQHNEAAWDARLPFALRFLFPTTHTNNQILTTLVGPHFDRDGNGTIDIDDLHHLFTSPADLNFDGVVDAADNALLEGFLRRDEAGDMQSQRR